MTDTVLKTKNLTLKQPCGFCRAGRHQFCPGATDNPGTGGLAICPCDCIDIYCLDCFASTDMVEIDLETRRCIDRFECVRAVAERVEAAELVRQLRECQSTRFESGEAIPRPRRATKTEVIVKKAAQARAKEGKCRCCGEVTKGGAFLPGHDARYIKILATGINEGVFDPIEARKSLADKPALLAKLDKRIETHPA